MYLTLVQNSPHGTGLSDATTVHVDCISFLFRFIRVLRWDEEYPGIGCKNKLEERIPQQAATARTLHRSRFERLVLVQLVRTSLNPQG